MSVLRTAKAVFVAGMALCLCQIVRAYRVLPAVVPSHFGPSGAPNAWASRGLFLGLYAGAVALLAVFLGGSVLKMQNASDDYTSRLRLPNKDYWLAPERRRETVESIAARLLWFGAATYALLYDMFSQAILVGQGLAMRLGHPFLSMMVYIAFTTVWIASLQLRFRKP